MSPPKFNDWGLEEPVQKAIAELGWEEPTEMQLEAIPVARQGRDVVGEARTGAGKTAAFGIPIIEANEPAAAECEPPRYRWHLGCILLKMPAISLLTG